MSKRELIRSTSVNSVIMKPIKRVIQIDMNQLMM
nr:unnamed protein product [Callosobruchus chinensis]